VHTYRSVAYIFQALVEICFKNKIKVIHTIHLYNALCQYYLIYLNLALFFKQKNEMTHPNEINITENNLLYF
jgi:hypothetical protein